MSSDAVEFLFEGEASPCDFSIPSEAAVTRLDGCMFVHGGMSKNGTVLNDFHFYEVAGGAVRTSRILPRQADEPFPRYAHAIEAARINGRSLLFLYGGYSPVKRLCDDLWIFDFQKRKWESPAVKGEAPRHAAWHTFNVHCGARKAFVFGCAGWSVLYSLCLDSYEWMPIGFNDTNVPKSRWCHSATIEENGLIIFGGCTSKVDLNDMWKP
eukprot:GHVO01005224.1.p1 GENE.GHVO01005224.1~~GHVO01005224.1.p1  ORF type:complete len:211 (-),score=15.21 GHVO01005224.1:319-951(-)